MENQEAFKTPKKMLARMQVVHLGKILFNLQFLAVAVMAFSMLSFIFTAGYYMILICAAFLTLFTLFLNPTFRALWSGGEALTKFAEALADSWKFTVPIVAALALAAIACLCFDAKEKHTVRIVASTVICAIAVVVLITELVVTGGV